MGLEKEKRGERERGERVSTSQLAFLSLSLWENMQQFTRGYRKSSSSLLKQHVRSVGRSVGPVGKYIVSLGAIHL